MTTLAPSFLICSSLFLQVTRATIKSRKGSQFGRIRPGTYELAALEQTYSIDSDKEIFRM